MAEQIPITPIMVTWARQRAGLSIEDAAKAFRKIEEWENGASFPTYSQLESLSDAFKLPIAAFFFPEPPKLPPIEETFRTLPEAERALIPSRVKMLLRKAKALQINLSEVTDGRNPAPRLITNDLVFTPDVETREMVGVVRDYLGVTMEQQIAWDNDEAALKSWRSVFADCGIFVFKDAFRVEEYSGFCLYDPVFPIIYVNNSTAKTRQIFTLFHELAHLLFHTSGIDTRSDEYIPRLRGDDRRIEITCNRFAAQFLVPEEELDSALRDNAPSEQTAEVLAARYHVSRETIYRRFLDRGLIQQEAYEEAAEKWAKQRQGGGGGDYYRTKLAYLGREYVSLMLREYHRNRIDEAQLAEYLDTKARNVGNLEEYFERGGV
jgi:Zn-dependent peptidase ImmA (M78 family)